MLHEVQVHIRKLYKVQIYINRIMPKGEQNAKKTKR
jgi:hypothetical protein